MGENLWPVADHVDNHEDHLFFTMRNLIEAKGRKMQLIVGLEDIFENILSNLTRLVRSEMLMFNCPSR